MSFLKKTREISSLPYRLMHISSLPSTNTRLAAMAKEGEKEGLVLWADKQSRGHGRFDRTFYSPRGSGVYMSVLLRPTFPRDALPLLPALAAQAAAEAAEALSGKRVGIKWVNDLYLEEKKIAGILCESGFSKNANNNCQNELFVVIGIGFNLYTPPAMPEALKAKAGGLFQSKKEMRRILGRRARETFITALLARLHHYLKDMPNATFLEGYRSRSVLIDRHVYLHNAAFDTAKMGEGEKVKVLSINERCALIVETASGEQRAVDAGEVTLSL